MPGIFVQPDEELHVRDHHPHAQPRPEPDRAAHAAPGIDTGEQIAEQAELKEIGQEQPAHQAGTDILPLREIMRRIFGEDDLGQMQVEGDVQHEYQDGAQCAHDQEARPVGGGQGPGFILRAIDQLEEGHHQHGGHDAFAPLHREQSRPLAGRADEKLPVRQHHEEAAPSPPPDRVYQAALRIGPQIEIAEDDELAQGHSEQERHQRLDLGRRPRRIAGRQRCHDGALSPQHIEDQHQDSPDDRDDQKARPIQGDGHDIFL